MDVVDLDRLYATVKHQHGHIDILFANAGVWGRAPLGKITEAYFDNVFNINVKGLLFTVQKAMPLVQDGSSIILNSSAAASKGIEESTVYSASKAAVRSFARTWSVELKTRKIRVNAVSPGPINTPLWKSVGETKEQIEQALAGLATMIPLGRLGDPDDVAKAALFLASDDSSFITGAELFLDGGLGQV
jgi:NAD(P)-dependent dehydrogenase (short-subunit alcohol dehydrogenase family)